MHIDFNKNWPPYSWIHDLQNSIQFETIPTSNTKHTDFNSLAPGKFEWKFRYVIFKRILVIDGWGISSEIALIWMSLEFIDDQSTLVQVTAWCRQATSHYLNQCWLRSLLPYGVTKPQGVKHSNYLSICIAVLLAAHVCDCESWAFPAREQCVNVIIIWNL